MIALCRNHFTCGCVLWVIFFICIYYIFSNSCVVFHANLSHQHPFVLWMSSKAVSNTPGVKQACTLCRWTSSLEEASGMTESIQPANSPSRRLLYQPSCTKSMLRGSLLFARSSGFGIQRFLLLPHCILSNKWVGHLAFDLLVFYLNPLVNAQYEIFLFVCNNSLLVKVITLGFMYSGSWWPSYCLLCFCDLKNCKMFCV